MLLFSPGSSCKSTKSAFRSTPVSGAAMVHAYHLAQLCWIAPIIGSGGSHFDLCSGLAHGHVILNLHLRPLHLPGIALLFVGRRLPLSFSVSCIPSLPGAERYSVSPRYLPCLSSIPLHFPALSPHCDGLDFLRTLSAECNMIPLAVQAFFLCMAAYCSLFQCAPDHIAPVLARSGWSGAVAALRLMVAALALDVAPSATELAEAVGACVGVRFDLVLYSCSN